MADNQTPHPESYRSFSVDPVTGTITTTFLYTSGVHGPYMRDTCIGPDVDMKAAFITLRLPSKRAELASLAVVSAERAKIRRLEKRVADLEERIDAQDRRMDQLEWADRVSRSTMD